MIGLPKKRVWGLIGEERAGKDTVAEYLQESRNFVPMAFADRIKEEFGISKGDFEAAKISGSIESIRQDLWDFSAKKKAQDPLYFIKKVIDDAIAEDRSVIITDIRTEDEFGALFEIIPKRYLPRAYFVTRDNIVGDDDNIIVGSKLKYKTIYNAMQIGNVRSILNNVNGLGKLFRRLDEYFFAEDISDIICTNDQSCNNIRNVIAEYVARFNIVEK